MQCRKILQQSFAGKSFQINYFLHKLLLKQAACQGGKKLPTCISTFNLVWKKSGKLPVQPYFLISYSDCIGWSHYIVSRTGGIVWVWFILLQLWFRVSSQFGGSSVEVRAIASSQNHIRIGNDQNIKGFNNLIKHMMHWPNIVNGECQLRIVKKLNWIFICFCT